MKSIALQLGATLLFVHLSFGQGYGYFRFANPTAPTHLYSIDGPLAGRGIWAHMFIGEFENDLYPIGHSVSHISFSTIPTGLVDGGYIRLDYPDETEFFVQMVVWDGNLWGSELSDVPDSQLGRTDIVQFRLFYEIPPTPQFTQSAIVPIPEPSAVTFLVMALVGLGFALQCWRRE